MEHTSFEKLKLNGLKIKLDEYNFMLLFFLLTVQYNDEKRGEEI